MNINGNTLCVWLQTRVGETRIQAGGTDAAVVSQRRDGQVAAVVTPCTGDVSPQLNQ